MRVDNPFGPQLLEVDESELLCVPSQRLACGIGFELVLVLPPLLWLYQRRARGRARVMRPIRPLDGGG